MAGHAAQNRLADPAPVARDRLGGEARAAIAHEDLHALRARLGVHVDGPVAPNFAAFVIASRAAATTASPPGSSSASPTVTTSTATP